MNAIDTRTPAGFPMPDTNCPRWCQEDHRESWEQWVAGPVRSSIPAAQWMPYHRLPVGATDIDMDDGKCVRVELVRDASDTFLYLDAGEGSMTAVQARQVAALLLDAADELDKVTR
jgi:hypothetical protein